MATVEELTDPYAAAYTPPPHAGAGVCDVCHNAPGPGYSRCYSCTATTRGVTHPLELVVPVSLCTIPSQLHTVLHDYKRSRDEYVQARHRLQIAATLHRFVRDHGDHIRATADSDWDIITVVPSKTPRDGPHPLERAVQLSPLLAPLCETVLEPWEPEAVTRAKSSDRGFRAVRSLEGESVLLLDDLFTSGATFQSAASALALGGARVVAGVVVGRVIHPDFSAEMQELWDRQHAIPFDFGACCLEP